MSNHESLPKREIKIKPIEYVRTTMDPSPMVDEVEKARRNLELVQQELNELQEKKKAMLQDLQATIQQEKANWETEKQIWIEKATEDGYRIGFQQGEKASIEAYREALDQANKIVDLVKLDYQKTLEQREDVIIELAIHTAEKILGMTLQEQPDKFLPIVQAALKEINDQSVISIYLHPDNYVTVLTQKAELKRIIEKDTKLSIYVNEELKENSCVIEHPFGQIDASVDTQLGEIRNALKELVMEQE